MADDQTTDRPGIGIFIQAMKQQMPNASDADLAEVYDATTAYNKDPTDEKAKARALAATDKLNAIATQAVQDKQAQAAPAQVVVNGTKLGGTDADATSTKIPAQVAIQTQLPSQYRGTVQEQTNPVNPQASTLSQFDPAALQAAQATYNDKLKNLQQNRLISNAALGFVAGFDGGKGQQNNAALYDQLDKDAQQPLAQQLALQNRATQGMAAAASQQNQDIAGGKYTAEQNNSILDQADKRLKLIVNSLGTQQQQRLADPASPDTMMLKKVIAANAETLPPAAKAALTDILANSDGVSAMQLLPVIGQYAPALQKSYLDMLSGNNTQASTRKINAEATGEELGNKNQQTISRNYPNGGGTAPAGNTGTAPAGNTGTAPAGNTGTAPVANDTNSERRNILIQELITGKSKLAAAKPGTIEYTRAQSDIAAQLRELRGIGVNPAQADQLASSSTATPITDAEINAATGGTMPPSGNTPSITFPNMQVNGMSEKGRYTLGVAPGANEVATDKAKIQQLYPNVKAKIDDVQNLIANGGYVGKGGEVLKNFTPSDTNLIAAKLAQIQAAGGALPAGILSKDKDGLPTLNPNMPANQLIDLLNGVDSDMRRLMGNAGSAPVSNAPAPGPSQPTQKPSIFDKVLGAVGGSGGKAPAAQAPAAAPGKNSKGWLLHTDKNGNRAYVSPDGKQFEEVK